MRYDAIVIGAGHNGLIAAASLAKFGGKVLVLERNRQTGGLCRPFEVAPGYTCPGILPDTSGFRPIVARSLQLQKYGLRFEDRPPHVLGVAENGASVVLTDDPVEDVAEIGHHSKNDAESWTKWNGLLKQIRPSLLKILEVPPPDMSFSDTGDLFKLGLQGFSVRRLGRRCMLDLLRILPMSVTDWLEEFFESPLLVQTLALPGVFGSFSGPGAAGTAANLLIKTCTAGPAVKGGPAGLLRALEAACRQHSVTLRAAAPVQKIRVQNGRVKGVELENGETLETDLLVSTCHPTQTLLGLLDPSQLEIRLERELRNYRSRGILALVNLALNAPLTYRGRGDQLYEFVRVGGEGPAALERAFDAVKYGHCASSPCLDIWMPSVSLQDLAPRGHHVASILVYCAPWDIEGAWSEARREELYQGTLRVLERHVSDLKSRIEAHLVQTPMDLERSHALRGGHLCHGEHALDQLLFMRPSPSLCGYRTPIRGLYLAGSGTHPGGGITGLPGFLAAETVRKDT